MKSAAPFQARQPDTARFATNPGQPLVRRKNGMDLRLACFALLLSAGLAWPAFHAVHLEGFTAQIQSMALLMSRAPGLAHDPYLPLVSQFIYQTRSAVIDALAFIYRWFPDAGDQAFHALVLLSFVALAGSAMVFARRWGGVHPVLALLALMLTQGIPESAFFFNDNIVSAGLAGIGLALISKRPGAVACIFSGLFFGLAVLARVDAIFMLPMAVGLVCYTLRANGPRLLALATLGLSGLAVMAASAWVHGFTPVDALMTAGRFVIEINDKNNWFWIRVFFFGLGSLPLLAIGGVLVWRRMRQERSLFGLLTFIVYPAALALLAPKATEVRYIFPLLAPMVALHTGIGLQWVCAHWLHGEARKRRLAQASVLLAVVVAVLPQAFLRLHDGPRAALGRLWLQGEWARWQGAVDQTMDQTRQLTGLLDHEGQRLLVSTHYNDEFYMRLRLMEAGFLPQPAASAYPGCQGFSVFRKGSRLVAHVRTDPQYRIAPITIPYNAALQLSAALSCDALRPDAVYVSTFGMNQGGLPAEIYPFSAAAFAGPLSIDFQDLRSRLDPGNPMLRRQGGILGFISLEPDQVQALRLNAASFLSRHAERDPLTGKVITIDDYEKYYAPTQGPTNQWISRLRSRMLPAPG